MGRGPGAAQRAILDALTAADTWWLTIPDLAERTGRSERQVRTAVHGLETRELVVVTYGHTGWKGRGDYGRWVRANGAPVKDGGWADDLSDPRIRVAVMSIPWSQMRGRNKKARSYIIRGGMPVFGLRVWLPERQAQNTASYRWMDDEEATARMQGRDSRRRPDQP
jgi:hypothetical protein